MKPPTFAPVYAWLFPFLAGAAQSVGYCLALHGSLGRDLDVLAVPWTREAVSALELVDAIRKAAQGFIPEDAPQNNQPEEKPHGRLAWCITLENGAYIDLSVMPRDALMLD